MARSRALAAQGESVLAAEQVVTSALGYQVWCSLPEVDDGSGVTVDDGHEVSVFANSTGSVEVLDNLGKRVMFVRPFTNLTFVATDNPVRPWEVRRPGTSEPPVIADLACTASATAAAASTFSTAYVKADEDAVFDAQLEITLDLLETSTALIFAEIEASVNQMIAACVSSGVISSVSQAEGTDTLALAALTTPQVVDDSERTVTSARAFKTIAVLPKIVASGTGTAVPPTQSVRITATSTGPIEVWDFFHRRVTTVMPYTSRTVVAQDADTNQWADIGLISETDAKAPAPTVAPLSVTMPTAALPAMDGPSSYDDSDWNTAADLAIDTAFGGFDTTLAAAFAQVETTMNALLVALEVAGVVAAS